MSENLLIYLQLSHVIYYNLQQQQNKNNTNQIIEICWLITAESSGCTAMKQPSHYQVPVLAE